MPPRTRSGKKPGARAGSLAILVRHGQTSTTGQVLPGRAAGLHLSEGGLESASRVALALSAMKHPPAGIYASPLERARETAAPIARALSRRVVVDRGLNECDFGEWTGRSLTALSRTKEWESVQNRPNGFRFPGGESFEEMRARVWGTLLRLSARHQGEAFVAVSHADCIKAAVAEAAGIPLDLFQRLVVSPCSISVIAFGANRIHVVCMNRTTSIDDLALS